MRVWQPSWISVLLLGCILRLIGSVLIFWIDDHTRSAMVIGLDHLAFVKRQPFPAWAAEPVVGDWIGTFLFLKLLPGTEQA